MTEILKSGFGLARTKLLRRSSGLSDSSPTSSPDDRSQQPPKRARRKASFPSLRRSSTAKTEVVDEAAVPDVPNIKDTDIPFSLANPAQVAIPTDVNDLPTFTVQKPTPGSTPLPAPPQIPPTAQAPPASNNEPPPDLPEPPLRPLVLTRTLSTRPTLSRTSSKDSYHRNIRQTLPRSPLRESANYEEQPRSAESQTHHHTTMPRSKIWVKRQHASPTLVQVSPDDLVDDVKDMVLRKYANSLGRSFDSPDVALRIIPREPSAQEYVLKPDDAMWRIIESYYPGGQQVDEALIIDVPLKNKTPRVSPRVQEHRIRYQEDDLRPVEEDIGYFPPMPQGQITPRERAHAERQHPHSIAILETGQLPPPLPSPRERKAGHHRPRVIRQHTSSPTLLANQAPQPYTSASYFPPSRPPRQRRDSDAMKSGTHPPNPPPLPTPPASEVTGSGFQGSKISTPPIDRVSSPRLPAGSSGKPRKSRRSLHGNLQRQSRHGSPGPLNFGVAGLLNGGAVPPINVLIVEDNIINLKLLEAFVKRLKVRWATAMNGREAVNKWREGGFHLVLMDIQLPIMSGLEATKEIRRLERVNGIGVFARSEGETRPPSPPKVNGDADPHKAAEGDDKLMTDGLFKSPVIIVALTASSLQSDRHEALAAGCNDFLTKPVNFVWFERKVMEWGCMQALIDFDGWRQWKAIGQEREAENEKKRREESEEDRIKREKKEAKRAAILAKMGQT